MSSWGTRGSVWTANSGLQCMTSVFVEAHQSHVSERIGCSVNHVRHSILARRAWMGPKRSTRAAFDNSSRSVHHAIIQPIG